ncbi:hypothetical protein AB0M02_18320 [Actinoplanes sp. NPDC051861]|uniref:hypothetical protein n=1 Tax=Actinoplanes sp. NPDC051861 TaxID=3155170 RepID=UPI00342ABD22
MRTVVIAGGTRGIGGALASLLEARGWRVVALGSADGDLSSVPATTALISRLPSSIDALVLSAGWFSHRRVMTPDGLERSFAVNVLARHLLVDGLRPALERSASPVVLNLCGVGGIRAGRIHWEDPSLERGYSLFAATMQGARAVDLLGVGYPARYPGSPVRYVLYNPLLVNSGMHRNFPQPRRAVIGAAAALFGHSTARAAAPLVSLVESPPDAPVTALRRGRPVALPSAAESERMYEMVAALATSPG